MTPAVSVAGILAAARIGGHLVVRMGQPAVLGELVAGVTLGSADLAGIGGARRGQFHRACRALKQVNSEIAFQLADGPADRPMCDVQLVGGPGKTQETGRCLEGAEGIERRKTTGRHAKLHL